MVVQWHNEGVLELIDRICCNCGARFRVTKSKLARELQLRPDTGCRFCCRKCFGEWRFKQNHEMRRCVQCGREFTYLKVNERHGGKGIYCSLACMNSFRRKTQTCAACGELFTVIRAVPRKYCSQECAGVAANRITKTCQECGASYNINRFRDEISRYCSMKCKLRAEGVRRTVTAREAKNRTGAKVWMQLRAQILARDGYACQQCGSSNKQLTVHHKTPWRKTKDNSPDNLITLCRPCHFSIEPRSDRRAKC